ncbi:allantoate permease [Microdochium bolleyi]|uniref:Allantoate permease n=1 Tax=Microdochium bolleyi TaxID=196109 RepID=A0A136JHN0_9PEZI|nr:allantoate permease [Microdochium bolleyi]
MEQYSNFNNATPEFHDEINKRLLSKVDLHLLPMLVLMYLLNFLDRSNLAQARLGTLEKDLGMQGTDFNTATSILFVGYLLMQLPSNLLLTRVRPSVYLSLAMCVWGVISTAQAAARSYPGLVVARFFLGFSEAPFFPGAVFLMSSWYKRSELTRRMAWFYAGSSLANAFGGLIGAGVLSNLEGAHGIAGWRWLFIIEGVITIGSSLISLLVLPDYPLTTRWLSPEEQAYAAWRLRDDTGDDDDAGAASIKEGVMLALRDPRLYLFTLLQHCSILSQSFQYFFPSIVKTLNYGNVQTLLLTVPVWIGTFLVSLVVTYTSSRTGDRSYHIIILMLVSVVGNIIAVATLNTGARFFAMFLLPMGAVAAYQIILSWVANSFPRPLVKRSACISIANMIANCANIYGPFMYPATDAPRYLRGGVSTAAVAVLVAALAFVLRMVLKKQNEKLARAEVVTEDGNVQNLHGNSREAGAVGFRYIL